MEIKNKIVLKDVGDPKKAIALLEADKNNVLMGTVYGICTDESQRMGPDGLTPSIGLKGTFSIKSVDGNESRSGLLYLQKEVQDLILAQLFNDKGERIQDSVKFAFGISLIRASNPQGYSWSFQPLMEPTTADPLSEFIASVPAIGTAGTKQIAAPKENAKK